MRPFMLFIALGLFITSGCKPKQDATKQATITAAPPVGTTLGKVSHQYRKTGCATVVIVKLKNEDQPITLIPKDTLAPLYNVDGLEILFNYHTLRMPNPKGCNVGIPAEIKDISKK